jgi:hypothetical protein
MRDLFSGFNIRMKVRCSFALNPVGRNHVGSWVISILIFIEHWLSTYEPRNAGNKDLMTTMPLILFPKQKELVIFLMEMVSLNPNFLCASTAAFTQTCGIITPTIAAE